MNVMTRFVRTAEFEFVNYANFATYCEEPTAYRVIESNRNITTTTLKLSDSPDRIKDCLAVLRTVLNLTFRDETCTQRDLYYRQETHFESNVGRCYRAIECAALVLNVPRRCLRINASPRGMFAGIVDVNDGMGMPQDVSFTPRLITPAVAFDENNLTIHPGVRTVLHVSTGELIFSFRSVRSFLRCMYECMRM